MVSFFVVVASLVVHPSFVAVLPSFIASPSLVFVDHPSSAVVASFALMVSFAVIGLAFATAIASKVIMSIKHPHIL
jgi:hypothetical protein